MTFNKQQPDISYSFIHFPIEPLNDVGFKQFLVRISKRIKMASNFTVADFSSNLWFTSQFEDFSKESWFVATWIHCSGAQVSSCDLFTVCFGLPPLSFFVSLWISGLCCCSFILSIALWEIIIFRLDFPVLFMDCLERLLFYSLSTVKCSSVVWLRHSCISYMSEGQRLLYSVLLSY